MTLRPDPRDPQARLEQFVQRTLGGLPPRPAPRTLEQRVLAEIARRAALPWWRQSFTHWPVPARAFLVLALVGIVKLVLMATVWVMAGFDTASFQQAFAQPLAWWEGAQTLRNAIVGTGEAVVRSLPPLWLYGGLAFFATMYATLFGLGAAAYKLLRAHA